MTEGGGPYKPPNTVATKLVPYSFNRGIGFRDRYQCDWLCYCDNTRAAELEKVGFHKYHLVSYEKLGESFSARFIGS